MTSLPTRWANDDDGSPHSLWYEEREKPFLKDRKPKKLRYFDQYQSDTIRSPRVMKGDSP